MISLVALAILFVLIAAAASLHLGQLDNRLGGDMPDPQTSLRRRLQAWLGIDQLRDTLHRIEDTMANEMIDLLQGLAAQTSDLTATQQAAFTNIHNGQVRLETQINDLKTQLTDALQRGGKVTPDMQAAADQISEALADLKKAATVASSDFDEPADDEGDQPAEGGDTPPADGEDTPVDKGGDVPVEQPVEQPATPADNTDDTQPVETPDGGNTRASRR